MSLVETIRFIHRYIVNKKLFWIIFLVCIVDGIFIYSLPFLISRLSTKTTFDPTIIAWITGLYIATLCTSYFIRRIGEYIALTSAEGARIQLFDHVTKVSLSTLQEKHSGYILSLINRVCDSFPPLLFQWYWWFARGLVNFSLFLYITSRESGVITGINLTLLLMFVLLSQYLSIAILPLNLAVSTQKNIFSGRFVDFMANITTVKRLGIAPFAREKLTEQYAKVDDVVRTQQRFHAFRWFLLHALFGLIFIGSLAYLFFQVTQGAISVSIFIIFIAVFNHLRGDLNQLAENLKWLTELKGYTSQLDEILFQAQMSPLPVTEWDTLQYADISFRYPRSTVLIRVPTFHIEKGDVIGITGRSGQGKSTVLAILAGHIKPRRGGTFPRLASEQCTYVSQEVELFDTSLRDNLTLGAKINDTQLLTTLEQLDLTGLVKQHTRGLDTIIGEKGLRLSAGQKQRVNIARAILQNREMIFLDEPISHLDMKTAQIVVDFLRVHLTGKTAVIVSHQPMILSLCNKQYHMSDHCLQSGAT